MSLTPLNSLLKAAEKQVVVKIINLVFVEISNPSTSSHMGCAPEVQQLLELDSIEEALQVNLESYFMFSVLVLFLVCSVNVHLCNLFFFPISSSVRH